MIQRLPAIERRVAGATVLGMPGLDDVIVLEPTACIIWSALDEPIDRSRLIDLVGFVYPNVEPEDLERTIDIVLIELERSGFIRVD